MRLQGTELSSFIMKHFDKEQRKDKQRRSDHEEVGHFKSVYNKRSERQSIKNNIRHEVEKFYFDDEDEGDESENNTEGSH